MGCIYMVTTYNFNEVFSSLVVACAIIISVYGGYRKLKSILNELYVKKQDVDSQKKMVLEHEQELKTVASKLDTIIEKIDQQEKRTNESNVVNLKYDLYTMYEKCTRKGYATEEELKCYLEKEKIYVFSGGNDFIHDKIHPSMLELPVKPFTK